MKEGIKAKDAIHIASAIVSSCQYFLTTDKRLLKYKTDKIRLMNPVEFVKEWGEYYDN
jgi:predicted nucleic acid-binding protein